mmetsp:Transcript_10661/g.15537  ORF Transcript_10661/g.15537 Transcript_10661/m.15537 type:complete len:340 (-) Transcript_10661:249-1268(-)
MLTIRSLKKASKSQEDGATLVASSSEDVDDYFLDEFPEANTTKEKKSMKKMPRIFTKSKITKQDSSSSDELSDDEGGPIPFCVADDFDVISNGGGLARFDYKALKYDLENFANAIFPSLDNSQSHIQQEKVNRDENKDEEVKTRKMIPKKSKVTGTLGLSRLQRTNNVVPNSTLSPRNRAYVRPKSKEGRLPLPDSFSRSMSNIFPSGDFKENETKVPREQLKRATKDYNNAVNSAASHNIINEQRIQRGLSFASRKDRKDLGLKTSILQGSHNWMKHSNSKKILKSSRSESSSISSSRHRRSNDNSSKESRNKNSVVISHVDGSRVVRSRVAVMQGLK